MRGARISVWTCLGCICIPIPMPGTMIYVRPRDVAFEAVVGRQDAPAGAALLPALEQRIHGQLLRPDVLQRRQPPAEHVVEAPVCPRPLEGCQVARLLDHAQQTTVATLVP